MKTSFNCALYILLSSANRSTSEVSKPQYVNSLHGRIAAVTTRNSILKMDVDTITLFVDLFTTKLKPEVQDFGS